MYWVQNKQYIDIYEHTRRRCGFEGRTSLHTSKKKKLSKAIVNLYTAYQGFYKNIFEPVRDREQNNYSESKLSRGQLTILVKPQARSHFC